MRAMPRYTTAALVLALLCPGAARAAFVTRHELTVTVDPATCRLEGRGTLTLEPDGGPPELLLADGLTLTDADVEADGTPRPVARGAGHPAAGRPGRTAWPVPFGPATGAVRLRVAWSGAAPVTAAPGASSSSSPASYCAADGVFLAAAAGWYPTGTQLLSTYRVEARVPGAWRALANGRLEASGLHGDGRRAEVFDGTHPLPGLDLAAAPWSVHEETVNGQRVAAYVLPGTAPEVGEQLLDAARTELERDTRAVGPHAWPQLVIAEHRAGVTLTRPSFVLLAGPLGAGGEFDRAALAHAVLHDWWGQGVYVDAAAGDWSEPLVTFAVEYARAEASPGADAVWRRAVLRAQHEAAERGERPTSLAAPGDPHDPALLALRRGRGVFALAMLRAEIGAAPFAAALRDLYAGGRQRVLSWQDLESAFAAAARRPLAPFFTEWVLRPDLPRVRFAAHEPLVTAARDDRLEVTATLDVTPGWTLGIPLEIHAVLPDRQIVTRRVVAWSREEDAGTVRVTARVPLETRSVRAFLDPATELFRELLPGEVVPTLAAFARVGPDLVVLGTARGAELRAAQRNAAIGLGKGGARIREDREVAAADLAAAKNAWIVGLPAAGTAAAAVLAAALPAGASLSERALALGGRSAAGPDAAAALVLSRAPGPGSGTLGVLDGLGPAALAGLVRRLPECADYSTVLYAGELPLVRDIAPPPAPPVAVLEPIP